MLNQKLLEVISHEGVVAIVSCSNNEAHVVNTCIHFLVLLKMVGY